MIVMDKKSKALLQQIAGIVAERIGSDPKLTETALTQTVIDHVERKARESNADN